LKKANFVERNTFPDIPNEISVYREQDLQNLNEILKTKTAILDMGCGHGDYLLEHTVRSPEKFFIGVEISRKRTAKTSARLHKRGIKNYAVIHSDGELSLEFFFGENTLDEVNVNFPDPWQRKRQWKNRILRPSFLIQCLRVLKPGGILNFVSDVEEYAVHASEVLKDFPGFENCFDKAVERNLYDSFPTLFYRKMSGLRDIHYIRFRKKA
jgi:tRNA (guanine-N7-)-methyltransferase